MARRARNKSRVKRLHDRYQRAAHSAWEKQVGNEDHWTPTMHSETQIKTARRKRDRLLGKARRKNAQVHKVRSSGRPGGHKHGPRPSGPCPVCGV